VRSQTQEAVIFSQPLQTAPIAVIVVAQDRNIVRYDRHIQSLSLATARGWVALPWNSTHGKRLSSNITKVGVLLVIICVATFELWK
jgi:hypothetical protein